MHGTVVHSQSQKLCSCDVMVVASSNPYLQILGNLDEWTINNNNESLVMSLRFLMFQSVRVVYVTIGCLFVAIYTFTLCE